MKPVQLCQEAVDFIMGREPVEFEIPEAISNCFLDGACTEDEFDLYAFEAFQHAVPFANKGRCNESARSPEKVLVVDAGARIEGA